LRLIDKHKALIITFLLTGIMVFAMFSFHISQNDSFISESFYEIEPETEEEKLMRELLEQQSMASLPKTNSAYNEDQEFKEMMKNFKSVNANDFERTTQAYEAQKALETNENVIESNTANSSNVNLAVKKEERSLFKKTNAILAMHTNTKQDSSKGSNANSTQTFSLKGREIQDYNTPRYLCETSGKIIVNITVNAEGNVIDTYLNTSSNSNNECLTEHALEYAKAVVFNTSSTASQIGSITFYFKGKN